MEVRGIGYAALARLGRLMEDTEIVFRQGVRKHGKPNLKASYLVSSWMIKPSIRGKDVTRSTSNLKAAE
jgi:hypothetical protein